MGGESIDSVEGMLKPTFPGPPGRNIATGTFVVGDSSAIFLRNADGVSVRKMMEKAALLQNVKILVKLLTTENLFASNLGRKN